MGLPSRQPSARPSKHRAPFTKWSIQSDVTRTGLEQAFCARLGNATSETRVLLDLSSVASIDIEALLTLVALIRTVNKMGAPVHIQRPSSQAVNAFFWLWGLDKALNAQPAGAAEVHWVGGELRPALCDIDELCQVIHPSSAKYQLLALTPESRSAIRPFVGREIGPDDDHLFQISTIFPASLSRPPNAEEVASEALQYGLMACYPWTSERVRSMLVPRLKAAPGYFANGVVFEAVENAVRHPNATCIHYAPVLLPQNADAAGIGFLDFAVWDNGNSIIDTARSAIPEAAIPEDPSYEFDIWINEHRLGQRMGSCALLERAGRENQDALVLLAAFLPGITSAKAAGMGLCNLMKSAAAVLRGIVRVRSGRYSLTLQLDKTAAEQGTYNVFSARISEQDLDFPGNLLSVRIPLSN